MLFCQAKSGSIKYTVALGENEEIQKSDIGTLFNSAKEIKNITFSLDFNPNEMVFYLNKTMLMENQDLELFLAFSNVDELYYKSKSENEILYQVEDESLGNLIIKSNLNIEWNTSNESKKIDNFVCYKATTSITVDNGDFGIFTYPVIAWYCPALPYSFGPKGYGGLPGLILELQERNVVFGATEINLKYKEDIVIKKPGKGKILSEAEYYKLLEETNK